MKKYLKLFIIGFLLTGIFGKSFITLADPVTDPGEGEGPDEFERLSTKKINSYCPESGNPNLVSICGRVVQALASSEVLSDGSTAPSVSQVPVKGVSVYLYECDNSSRSCKRDGLLVHPFSSTSTNKDGVFHLLGRKLENTWLLSYPNPYTNHIEKVEEDVTIANQSKKRYLVFKCGNYFQGIHIIPSYIDITEVAHEVNCPKEYLTATEGGGEEFVYVPPLLQFDFIGGVKLAAQMGIDDPDGYYPEQRAEVFEAAGENYDPHTTYEGLETTIQTHYDEFAYKKNQSVQVILNGADPRFTPPDSDSGKREAIVSAANNKWWELLTGSSNLENKVPELGAWYSKDCEEKYAGTDWFVYCGATEEDLYYDAGNKGITNEFLLPSLPPKQSLLYYRPLEIRNEISAYYQDQDDLAKYMNTMFANCMGPVFKRIWETDPDEADKLDYPDCELLKQCNSIINPDNNNNSLTTGGIAQALMTPGALNDLEYEVIPDIPVCLIDGEEEPVLLNQIQRPGQLGCKEGMRLCEGGSYWNNYFLTNLGNRNTTTQFTFAGENNEDSYSRKTTGDGELPKTGIDVNKNAFKKTEEGDGNFQVGGQVESFYSGGQEAHVTGGGLEAITAGSEILVDVLAAPFVDEDIKEDITGGIPYYISTRPVALGQFSKTNDYPEQIITSGSQDSGTDTNGDGIKEGGYLDPYAFSKEMECESCAKEHYPEDYLKKLDEIEVQKGKEWGGSRTPFEGITLTTAAELRNETLAGLGGDYEWKDRLDSQISVSTGFSYIDWGLVKIKKDGELHDLLSAFFNALFGNLFGINQNNPEKSIKTFVDRNPKNMENNPNQEFKVNDELVAYGFKVNESNFQELFTCASSPCTWNECWPEPKTEEGREAVKECYPWHPLGDGDTCKTAKLCYGGISQTCRIDVCKSGEQYFKYTCQENPNGTLDMVVTYSEDRNQASCTPATQSLCIDNQKNSGIRPIVSPTCTEEGIWETTHFYDYCNMSVAGPNECDGNILFDAEVNVYSQKVFGDDDLNSPDSFVADKIPESGLNLQKSFRDPFTEDFSYMPAAWVSVSSSLSNTEPDTSLRKDFPGIGAGTSFLTRAQFGEPHTVSSSNELEPLYIHCANSVLGTTGNWDDGKDCQFSDLPNPEVAEISSLERELETEIEENGASCLLKEDLSSCESLVLGESESGETLKFSETFKLILNLAGKKLEVEPAAILLYMHKIGADKEYAYYWSEEGEEDLKKFALPWYGTFPLCDDLEPVSQPPFDWKLSWFYEIFNHVAKPLGTTDSPKGVLKTLLGREHTASRCNFIDSIFTLAGSFAKSLVKIQKDANGNPIYTDITCNEQEWDDYMKNALKVQYYQLQINWDDELKGTLNEGYDDLFPPSEYQEIWNACR